MDSKNIYFNHYQYGIIEDHQSDNKIILSQYKDVGIPKFYFLICIL